MKTMSGLIWKNDIIFIKVFVTLLDYLKTPQVAILSGLNV
jgi:hypothetical protein